MTNEFPPQGNILTRRQLIAGVAATVFGPAVSPRARAQNLSPDGFVVLTAKKAKARLLGPNQPEAAIWGYNGICPGPMITARQGEKVKVRLVNELDQPTSIHWHGIRIDNAMDGVSGLTQRPVKPGKSFDYEFTAPDAGTFWYHTHNRSWEQLARGLYGPLIIEEANKPQHRELSIVLDDWRVTRDGQIETATIGDLHDWAHAGRLGNVLTVNGRSKATFEVNQAERLRVRIVNVANARIMQLDIKDHDPWVIALDGHAIAPRKVHKDDLILGPGQRVDLIVDATGKPGSVSSLDFVSQDQRIPVAILKYATRKPSAMPVPSTPEPLPVSMPHEGFDLVKAKTVELKMTGGAMGTMDRAIVGGKMLEWKQLVRAKKVWAFNGIAGDLDKPLITVKRGETVRIDIVNDTAFPHAMHLHGRHFSVVARNNMSVASRVWRDTEIVNPDERVSFAFLADNPGKWLFHCHMIEHQAGGMITWINVV